MELSTDSLWNGSEGRLFDILWPIWSASWRFDTLEILFESLARSIWPDFPLFDFLLSYWIFLSLNLPTNSQSVPFWWLTSDAISAMEWPPRYLWPCRLLEITDLSNYRKQLTTSESGEWWLIMICPWLSTKSEWWIRSNIKDPVVALFHSVRTIREIGRGGASIVVLSSDEKDPVRLVQSSIQKMCKKVCGQGRELVTGSVQWLDFSRDWPGDWSQ
jgi:hypothetical protein